MRSVLRAAIAALLVAVAAVGVPIAARGADAGEAHVVCRFSDPRLVEISGITWSRAHPGVYWVHNDSGRGPYLYAVDGRTCKTLARIRVANIGARDLEAIATGTDPRGQSVLWLGDIGDNRDSWPSVRLHAIVEPQRLVDQQVLATTYRFTYGDIPNDPRDGNFLITVWQDLDQDPIFQNITFSSPEYRLWGPDYFVEYPLDSTIAVGGTFYVGWTQTNAVKMNLGLDKNRVNSDKMFYNVGDTWQQSQAAGSWMIRPVMVSAVDPFAAVRETEVPNTLQLFPNPSSDEVRVRFTGGMPRSIELLDATGRKVLTERYRMDGMIAVDGLAEGLYVVRAVADDGQTLAQERLIVQH